MVGASARYSCLHTPVETVTSPRRQTKLAPRRFRRDGESFVSAPSVFLSNSEPLRWALSWLRTMVLCADQHFSGSGYSTPKVSTVTFFITWGIRGLSL